jgi:hypothetical protein
MRDLWWTKWQWHKYLSEFFSSPINIPPPLSILIYHLGDEEKAD